MKRFYVPRTLYVLALTAGQAERIMRVDHNTPRSEYTILTEEVQLHGTRGARVLLLGTWYERRDARRWIALLESRQAQTFETPEEIGALLKESLR